jgi:hypothetical protein
MNSRIVSLVAILVVACLGVGLLVFVLQAPKDPEGPPPGFEVPDYVKHPPQQGAGAGDPAKAGDVDWKPKDEDAGSRKKGAGGTGTGKSKEKP